MKKHTLLLLISILSLSVFGQERLAPFTTFATTRLLNNHSTETLKKRELDFRVTHRFGDIGGNSGGYNTLWGLDNSSDIRIAFEYGVTRRLMIGLGRSKGASAGLGGIFDGLIKYRLIEPKKELPLSLTLVESAAVVTSPASSVVTSEAAFDNVSDRFRYVSQLIVGYKVSDYLSVQLVPSFHHRNFVAADDKNSLFALGGGARLKLTKLLALNFEYTFSNFADRGIVDYTNEYGVGVEFDLGGHVFQVDITNAGGIGEYQFISGTTSDIADGEIRLGFTISRPFKI